MIGHLIPVVSDTGWSDGDIGYNDAYIIANYRILLSEAEYKRIPAEMRRMAGQLAGVACCAVQLQQFVGDIANSMGLQAPFHWLMPKDFVEGIEEMNGGRQELSPSSDEERPQTTVGRGRSRPKPTAAAQAVRPVESTQRRRAAGRGRRHAPHRRAARQRSASVYAAAQ